MKYLFLILLFLPVAGFGQTASYDEGEFSLGSPALVISLTGVPEAMEVQLPESILPYIRRFDAYKMEDEEKKIIVRFNYAMYTQNLQTNLLVAASGSIRQIETQGASDVTYSTEDLNLSGHQGIRQTGTLTMDKKSYQFVNTVFVEGTKLWQVMIMIEDKETACKECMTTMLESFYFKEN